MNITTAPRKTARPTSIGRKEEQVALVYPTEDLSGAFHHGLVAWVGLNIRVMDKDGEGVQVRMDHACMY